MTHVFLQKPRWVAHEIGSFVGPSLENGACGESDLLDCNGFARIKTPTNTPEFKLLHIKHIGIIPICLFDPNAIIDGHLPIGIGKNRYYIRCEKRIPSAKFGERPTHSDKVNSELIGSSDKFQYARRFYKSPQYSPKYGPKPLRSTKSRLS